MTQEGTPTITVDDKQYDIEGLPDEVKELLTLHQQAQAAMLTARRESLIQEVAVNGLVSSISARLKALEEESDAGEGELVS
ncbi:MAG: hypothetical protein CMJ25_21120 [Phycisphaerae bacterium]|nr:hypothetical protein [Phycisphaerae bacterium]|tara:strand:- start:542 stop:784 length:243 start_codon:yes stop_codon:yes gene_type:complete